MNFLIDELTIISMYTGGELTEESREGLIRELADVDPFIEERELRTLADSVREKVRCMSDGEFEKIDLTYVLADEK